MPPLAGAPPAFAGLCAETGPAPFFLPCPALHHSAGLAGRMLRAVLPLPRRGLLQSAGIEFTLIHVFKVVGEEAVESVRPKPRLPVCIEISPAPSAATCRIKHGVVGSMS